MSPLNNRGFLGLLEPPAKCCSAQLDQIIVNNAQYYSLEQNYYNIFINYLSGSRTPGTMNLCATALARRLCENL